MRTFALAIAATLLLASCTDDPKPIEPKPSASPKVSAPTLPKEARESTSSGAATFVAYWVRVSNFASQTGETAELSRISGRECAGCQTYIDLYEKTYANGGYFKGSEWTISNVEIQGEGNEQLVFAHVDAPVGTFKRSSDSKVGHGNAEDSDLAFGVTWTGKGWRMTQLGLKRDVAE